MTMEEIAAGFYGTIMGLWAAWTSGRTDRARKRRLRKMLSGKWRWRSLRWLSASIAADEETTKRLLIELDARPQVGNSKYWGLEARTGEP